MLKDEFERLLGGKDVSLVLPSDDKYFYPFTERNDKEFIFRYHVNGWNTDAKMYELVFPLDSCFVKEEYFFRRVVFLPESG